MSASHTQQSYIPTLTKKKKKGTRAHSPSACFQKSIQRKGHPIPQGLVVSYKVAESFACFFETGSRVVSASLKLTM